MSQDTEPHAPTIVLVGHCGFDGASLIRFAKSAAPEAEVVAAHRTAELTPHTHGRSLWLINRVLDGGFDSDMGVDLIRKHASADDAPRMMLVSNYDDAQQAAVDAGALPGFGKSALRDPSTVEKVREAIGQMQQA